MAEEEPEARWRELLHNAVPNLVYSSSSSRRTVGNAWHKDNELKQDVEAWVSFNDFVGGVLNAAEQHNIDDSAAHLPDYLFGLQEDYISCGDESTVVGRFFQHVGNSVNCLARLFGTKSDFGDFRIVVKGVRDQFGVIGQAESDDSSDLAAKLAEVSIKSKGHTSVEELG